MRCPLHPAAKVACLRFGGCSTGLPGLRRNSGQISGRRNRLISPRRFFSAIRRSFAARDGRVGRRWRGGGAIASATRATSRASAACRFRNCDRCSDAVTVRTPSTRRPARRADARSRWTGERAVDSANRHDNSTRVSDVFTDWPPGPLDRENRQESSAAGMTTRPATIRSPGMRSHLLTARRGCPSCSPTVPGARRPREAPAQLRLRDDDGAADVRVAVHATEHGARPLRGVTCLAGERSWGSPPRDRGSPAAHPRRGAAPCHPFGRSRETPCTGSVCWL